MEDEVEKLKTEIKVLNKRISILERNESRRKFFHRIKIIVDIIVIALIAFGLWYGYNYITNYIPDHMNEIIDGIKQSIFK